MNIRTDVLLSLGLIALLTANSAGAQEPATSVAGAVSVAGPDGQPLVLPGVTITLTCNDADPKTEVSNDQGEFRFADAGLGTCSIVADLQGFKSATKVVVLKAGETTAVTLQLGLDTLREDVMVSAKNDAAESPITAHVERMTAYVMQTAPIASERFQDALPLIPGVVRGPDGLLNINGTRSNQSALMFNSANGTDPVTGPMVKVRLRFLESIQYEYSQTRVLDLPPFESDTKLQSFESFSRADWTASQTNHFTGPAMVSPRKTTYAGLNTFNPQSVTPNIKNHNVLGSATDQIIVSDRGVLETRVSIKQFDSTIYPSEGDGPMVLAPDVNSGSYFNDQDRTSRRSEWLSSYSFAPLGPMHLIKVGAGVTHETFDAASRNRPVDIVRENGTLSQEI